MMNPMQEWKTLTGLTIGEAIKKMMEVLPPNAYKKVEGVGADLTDIDPAYLTKVATAVFGPCGLGWAYKYDPNSMKVVADDRAKKGQNGNPDKVRRVFIAMLPYFELRYRYIDSAGTPAWSEPVVSNGGNENDHEEFAMRGALTNALGAAWAKVCWQLPVYMGQVDHKNAEKKYAEQQRKLAGMRPEPQVEPATEPVVKQETAPEPLPQPVGQKAPEPDSSRPSLVAPSGEHNIEWADQLIIPDNIGVLMVGKPLSAARKNATIGPYIISYLSGVYPNQSGAKFSPGDEYGKALMEAANIIMSTDPTMDIGRKKKG